MILARLIKTKAVFEIFLIITAIFFINSLNVNAQANSDTAGNQACCEKTKSGESCVTTSLSNCDGNFKYSGDECSLTNFCKTGCCVNVDGTCGDSASKS